MKDKRGVQRGRCLKCEECEDYDLPAQGNVCSYCGCTPVQHLQVPETELGQKFESCQKFDQGINCLHLILFMLLAFLLLVCCFVARQRETFELVIRSFQLHVSDVTSQR